MLEAFIVLCIYLNVLNGKQFIGLHSFGNCTRGFGFKFLKRSANLSLEFWDVYLGKSNMHANNKYIFYVHCVLKCHQYLM